MMTRMALAFAILTILFLVMTATVCRAADFSLEVGPLVGLFPDQSRDFGTAVSIGFWTPPDDLFAVGGHRLFLDALYTDHPALGTSISVTKSQNDGGARFGAAIWKDAGASPAWELYLRWGKPLVEW